MLVELRNNSLLLSLPQSASFLFSCPGAPNTSTQTLELLLSNARERLCHHYYNMITEKKDDRNVSGQSTTRQSRVGWERALDSMYTACKFSFHLSILRTSVRHVFRSSTIPWRIFFLLTACKGHIIATVSFIIVVYSHWQIFLCKVLCFVRGQNFGPWEIGDVSIVIYLTIHLPIILFRVWRALFRY